MFQLKALVCSLLAVLALPHLASGYANPGACSGQCWTHDPAVVRRDDGVYFRFSTGSKIGIWKAPALEGPWTYQGAAIPAGSRINLPGRYVWSLDRLQWWPGRMIFDPENNKNKTKTEMTSGPPT